jgi:transcriptional regulator with XRE-family HTH domain
MSRREELHRFLSARRRAQGLTREQVADLAGVTSDWYASFESGAAANVSPRAIEGICRALQLDIAESVYLSRLAGQEPPRSDKVEPWLDVSVAQRIVDNYSSPACMLGPRFDLHAVNRISAPLMPFRSILEGRFKHNVLWTLFTDPACRRLLEDWETIAEDRVGIFRTSYGRHADNPQFQELVEALSEESPDFVRLWSAMKVRLHNCNLLKAKLRHPKFGPLSFDSIVVPFEEGSELMMWFAVPLDTRTRNTVAMLNADLQRVS